MVTIKDVARAAHVAPGTVSNVLTGKRPVSDATRARVLRAIDELGYQPNALARSLVNRRSETIAVVASGIEYYGPSRTVVGIERQADALGYSLLLSLLRRPAEDFGEAALFALTARQVDGIIWAVPEIGNNRAWILADRLADLPPIVFLSMRPDPDLTTVAIDNRGGAAQVASHLAGQGYRRIGMITGPLDWWEARERATGFTEALSALGPGMGPSSMAEGDWTAQSGERGLRCLLDRVPDLDAVFAGNDQMALGALRAAHLLGKRVPGDIAIVGFDNIPESTFFWPSLTTVHQGLVEAGCVAVKELDRLIQARITDNEHKVRSAALSLPTELIVRESSSVVR